MCVFICIMEHPEPFRYSYDRLLPELLPESTGFTFSVSPTFSASSPDSDTELPLMSKEEAAHRILDTILSRMD